MTDLADRYGRDRKRRWPVVAAVIVMGALTVWLAWAIWAHSSPKVTSALKNYTVDSTTATAVVDVARADTNVVATCILRAFGDDHGIVGETSFQVSDSTNKRTLETKTIRTLRPARLVQLEGCTAPGQSRPR